MAELLDPTGVAVSIGGVTLRTPGLAGTAEVHHAGGSGMRAAEDATVEFLDSLERAGVEEQLTVEIKDLWETDQDTGSRAAGGDTDIEAEVPGPGTGLGQFLLYTAEDGTVSWHLPVDVPRDPAALASRGGDSRVYRVPRSVAPMVQTDESGHRGLIGMVGSRLLKVLVFPVVDPVLGKVGDYFASRWEQRHRRNGLRPFEPATYRQAAGGPLPDWSTLTAGPALLFLHGTMSQSHTGFRRMPETLVAELHRRYEGRVLALDHFTVSVDPTENVRWLAKQLPEGLGMTVDVIAHSRGGLVGRVMAERGPELGLGGVVDVRTLVMVGTPNAGTVLADPEHLGTLLDRVTNLIQLVPDNPVTDTVDVVLTVLKQLAVGAFGGLDGLISMDPNGSYLREFLNQPTTTASTYRAVASNFEPAQGSPLARTARNVIVDVVFGNSENDLIVPTEGVYHVSGLDGFAPADPLVFPAAAAVDHSSFWVQEAFAQKVLEWLPPRG
ncbi:MAG TPA: alpha/beta hydrolase [Jiangellaceae bacterium]|nr:alpha/beta hydrolase [Jiangellaceae bacterium]